MVQITSYKKCKIDKDIIIDFTLDIPKKDFNPSVTPFGFMGWIAGGAYKFDTIEIYSKDQLIQSIPINMRRPDVAKLFPENPAGDRLGFFRYFNPFLLPQIFEINIFAISNNAEKIKLFCIGGKRQAVNRERKEITRPIVLTTLGRTGSTVSIAYLGAHPEIIAYRPYEVEARYASYWVQLFLSLSDPKSWIYPITADDRLDPGWILGEQLLQPSHFALYPEMFEWFNKEYTESLFKFCFQNLQRHYQQVANILNKKNASFFCEKFLPDPFTDHFLDLIPESKEIFLVRDFRDMVCSIQSFNKKRGFLGFGRERFQSDEAHITEGLAPGVNMLLEFFKKRRPPVFLLRYEDLILNTESSLKALFEYLGVDSSISTIQKVIKTAKEMNPKSQKNHQTSGSPENSIGRYKQELSPQILGLCNESFRAGLEGFGYDF